MKKIIYIILGALVVIGFLVSPLLIKVNIVCKSQFGECPPEITSKFKDLNGKSIFSAKNNISKVLKGNYLISDFSTQFKLPNVLIANILIKKPEFALSNPDSSKILLIDSDGTVLAETNSTTLPRVTTASDLPRPGDRVGGDTLTVLKIIQGVWNMYQVGTAQVAGDSLVVDLKGGINVIFPLNGDPEVLLGALRLIYTKITTGDSIGLYHQIDLRFKNPVLR